MSHNRASVWVVGVAVVAMGVVLMPSRVEAQGSDRAVGVGGKAAWSLSRVRGEAFADNDEPIDFSSGSGFSIGGLLAIAAGDNVTVQPEFIYSQKKVKADVPLAGSVAEGEIDSDWFEIPVLAKLHGRSDRGARPFALVGPTFSFLVNATQSLSSGGMSESEDIKDELIGTDVGLTFGGGVDFLQDWGVVTIDARYTLGLRNLSDEDDVKQDSFSVSGGIIF